MNYKGLIALAVCSLCSFASAYNPYRQDRHNTSWFNIFSCVAKQVPQLPEDFDRPLYQYLFETFARNTHLLPLGVPINSKAEDYQSTASFESCLWGTPNPLSTTNDIDDPEAKSETAYNSLFARRQGGYDYSVGLTLLSGKLVASTVGYIIHVLTL